MVFDFRKIVFTFIVLLFCLFLVEIVDCVNKMEQKNGLRIATCELFGGASYGLLFHCGNARVHVSERETSEQIVWIFCRISNAFFDYSHVTVIKMAVETRNEQKTPK